VFRHSDNVNIDVAKTGENSLMHSQGFYTCFQLWFAIMRVSLFIPMYQLPTNILNTF